MSANAEILKNFNVYVDGVGYAGKADTVKLPALSLKTEEHRAGGMDAPIDIDMGMEKLEATVTMASFDRALFAGLGNTVPLTARGAVENIDGTVNAVVVTMRGKMSGITPGDWTAGTKASNEFKLSLNYYKLEIGGVTVHEIDVRNMTRVINGRDQLAAQRNAIGL